MQNKHPMTLNGEKMLRDELAHLKTTERSNVVAAIAEARSHGDLSENAEYDAAKEKQGFIEGRIAEIEHKLNHAHIIDTTKLVNDGRVVFGAKVMVLDLESEQELLYHIVGDDEADIKISKISVHSPVAKCLIGKETGDVVEVSTPGGSKEYEILDFSF